MTNSFDDQIVFPAVRIFYVLVVNCFPPFILETIHLSFPFLQIRDVITDSYHFASCKFNWYFKTSEVHNNLPIQCLSGRETLRLVLPTVKI